ncbi:MAG: hypothetical protein A2039_10155 [Candidatus Melainabacteria bacterium GWA2_34_9]|nr:MAG: hypothetical protein A2039_10155 [Candidatus Melainabacteria bacterium GWA2_34_9]
MDYTNQQLIDNIVCHKSAIKQIDDKLNLINFIGSVNNAFIPKDLLNMEELKQEKKSLEKNLKLLKSLT